MQLLPSLALPATSMDGAQLKQQWHILVQSSCPCDVIATVTAHNMASDKQTIKMHVPKPEAYHVNSRHVAVHDQDNELHNGIRSGSYAV